MEPRQSVSKSALEAQELKVLEALLHNMAPTIDSLLADGIPYTKIMAPAAPPAVPPLTNAASMTGGQ